MKYSGNKAKNYGQVGGKLLYLFPAFERLVPNAGTNELLLDLGCGNGDLIKYLSDKGYKSIGLDHSDELIQNARNNIDNAEFVVADIGNFSNVFKNKFDVITISTVLNELSSKEQMTQALLESAKVLSNEGQILIGLPHPCFDGYMQSSLMERDDIKTEFAGYNDSGKICRITHTTENGELTFEDYHWTMQDYFECIYDAGLIVQTLDECYPPIELKFSDPERYKEKTKMPKYIVLVCKDRQ
jgi:SAM-dependent methyltransferase